MKGVAEKPQNFVPLNIFTSVLIESINGENILKRIITIRGPHNSDDSVPFIMNAHHPEKKDDDPFVRYGENTILIYLQYNLSSSEKIVKSNYHFSSSEEFYERTKMSQKITDKAPNTITLENPLTISIQEIASKAHNRVSHCIDIGGGTEITEKFRLYRSTDTITDEFATTTERVFISANRLRIHAEAILKEVPKSEISHNRSSNLNNFLDLTQLTLSEKCISSKGINSSTELTNMLTPKSTKSDVVQSKTGSPESNHSQTCYSITPVSAKSNLLSVKSRAGTPFIKKKFLSKSSAVSSVSTSEKSPKNKKTILSTISSTVGALRERSLFGRSAGLNKRKEKDLCDAGRV